MQTLLILMQTSESDKIRLDAAKDVLDRTGFKPEDILNIKGSQELEININLTGGDEDEGNA